MHTATVTECTNGKNFILKEVMHWTISFSKLRGSLSPQHDASGCGWRNGLQLWRVAANMLNKEPWTNVKRWSSSLGGWAWG
jgi:hypothetical protein